MGNSGPAPGARDQDALLSGDSGVYLTGGDQRMLEIAASCAAGRPTGLPEHGHRFGSDHARREAEAVATAAGMGGYRRRGSRPGTTGRSAY